MVSRLSELVAWNDSIAGTTSFTGYDEKIKILRERMKLVLIEYYVCQTE